MNVLLNGLAALGGLRDRQAMNFSMVQLLLATPLWQFDSVKLLQAVGPLADQHWLTLAQLQPGWSAPRHDHVWLDISTLPAFNQYPQREAAIVTELVQCSRSAPFVTVFPINTQASVCSVLEVESAAPLSVDTLAQVDSVLRLYENLQSLLDYGEKDTLTELLNRKTFDTAFWRAAQTQDAPTPLPDTERRQPTAAATASFWLAVIDIDHFKHVNDHFGHLIGDEVLLLLARLMRASFRFHDQLYRFGGEEFVVLMRCSSAGDAQAALERFRERIGAHEFPQVNHITISIGYTPLNLNDTPSGAFDRADKAVYYAKEHGRNQVCSYTDLVASGALPASEADSNEVDFF